MTEFDPALSRRLVDEAESMTVVKADDPYIGFKALPTWYELYDIIPALAAQLESAMVEIETLDRHNKVLFDSLISLKPDEEESEDGDE